MNCHIAIDVDTMGEENRGEGRRQNRESEFA